MFFRKYVYGCCRCSFFHVINFLTELRAQMQKFSVILVHLPPLVVQIIVADQLRDLAKERRELEEDYEVRVQELEKRKVK